MLCGVVAAVVLLSSDCGSSPCRSTNLVIDFPQPLPASAVIHVQVDDRILDVTCTAQARVQSTAFGQVSICSDKEVVLYFDSLTPDSIHVVSVSADLPEGSQLFATLPTSLGRPAMDDPDGNPGVCDVPVAILAPGHTPIATPPPGAASCAGGEGTVASFPYGTSGQVTITGLQVADGSIFMALNHATQGTYDVAVVALPCSPPVILASATGTVIGGPIVAAGSVFWATADGVLGVPAVGGTEQVVAATPLAGPVVFAATATSLVWIDSGGTVQRAALPGGPATVMATGWGPGAGIAANDSDVYFSILGNADWNAGADYGQGGLVLRVPLSGGDVAIVAANQQAPRDLALSATDLYWASAGTHSGSDPATSSGNPDGLILRQSLSGGAPVVLSSGDTNPAFLHLLEAAPLYPLLYWTEGGLARGYVPKKMPAAGGTPLTANGGSDMTFDADWVYWWERVFTNADGALFSAVVFGAPR